MLWREGLQPFYKTLVSKSRSHPVAILPPPQLHLPIQSTLTEHLFLCCPELQGTSSTDFLHFHPCNHLRHLSVLI